MRNEVMTIDHLPAVLDFRDLGICDPTKRLFQGDGIKNVDGIWSTDGVTVPHGTLLICVFAFRAVQHIDADGIHHADNQVEVPGHPLSSDDELAKWNDQIPKSLWQVYSNKQQPPFHKAWGTYLINPNDAALYTYINKTFGAFRMVERLIGSISRQNAVGKKTFGKIIEIHDSVVNKELNKKGPGYTHAGWVELTNTPAWMLSENAAALLEHKGRKKPSLPARKGRDDDADTDDDAPFDDDMKDI